MGVHRLAEDLPRQQELLRFTLSHGGEIDENSAFGGSDNNEIRMIEAVEAVHYDAHGSVESSSAPTSTSPKAGAPKEALRLSQNYLRHAADAARLTHVQFDLQNRRVQLADNSHRFWVTRRARRPEAALSKARGGPAFACRRARSADRFGDVRRFSPAWAANTDFA